jgi:hypothetical protein
MLLNVHNFHLPWFSSILYFLKIESAVSF